MGSFGGIEWLVIILVVLLLFGAKKIPELARGLGQGLTEFRKASSDIRKEIERGAEEPRKEEYQQRPSPYDEPVKSTPDEKKKQSAEAIDEKKDKPAVNDEPED